MSVATLPSLIGLGWDVKRVPIWQTRKAQSVSGKETRVNDWSYPRWQWTILYNMLRQGTIASTAYTEMQQLAGFFNERNGAFDSWLYKDAHDNTVVGQAIGTGDGATKNFQLIRAFGGFVEPILAPDLGASYAVYLNGVGAPSYTITPWDTSDPAGPGVIKFGTAPGAGVAITADFSWFFPVRFDDDQCEFVEMAQGYFAVKQMKFTSIK